MRRGVALGRVAVARRRAAAPSIRTTSAANALAGGRREERLDRPVLARREGRRSRARARRPGGPRPTGRGRPTGRRGPCATAAGSACSRPAGRRSGGPAGRRRGCWSICARVGERLADAPFGDLAEGHPAGLGRRHVGRLGDVPGDRLALAVEVGGEVDGVRAAWPPSRCRRPACAGRRRSRTRARSRGRRRRRTCPCRGSRAGRGHGRRRPGRGSRRRDSARSSAPWPATRRSRGSSARPGV